MVLEAPVSEVRVQPRSCSECSDSSGGDVSGAIAPNVLTVEPSGSTTGGRGEGASAVGTEDLLILLDKGLKNMMGIIKEILGAVEKQPGISRVVKDGLPKLEEAVDDLAACGRQWAGFRPGLPCKPQVKTTAVQTAPIGGQQQNGSKKAGTQSLPQRPPGKSGAVPTSSAEEPAFCLSGKRLASSPPLRTEGPLLSHKKRRAEPEPDSWMKVVRRGKGPVTQKVVPPAAEMQTESGQRRRKRRRRKTNKKANSAGSVPAAGAPGSKRATALGRSGHSAVKAKPEAILLSPASGKTYADVLSTVRRSVNPESSGVEVRGVRRTRNGQVLLELKKAPAERRAAFSDALRAAVGSASGVRELVPKLVW